MIIPLLVGALVGLALFRPKTAQAGDNIPASSPKRVALMPSGAVVGRIVSGAQPGVKYRVVDLGDSLATVTMEIVAYPPKPSLVGRAFSLGNTIQTHGRNHPTVRQVAALLHGKAGS